MTEDELKKLLRKSDAWGVHQEDGRFLARYKKGTDIRFAEDILFIGGGNIKIRLYKADIRYWLIGSKIIRVEDISVKTEDNMRRLKADSDPSVSFSI